jgi:multidrug resistance efflux pump
MDVAALQADVAEAEKRAAQVSLDHRRITAPLSGEVVELSRHEGEWVQPGDTVLRLVHFDKLRVEGFLNARDFSASEIQHRRVEVSVALAHDKIEPVAGTVVYVRPLIETGGQFLVRAEVPNRWDPTLKNRRGQDGDWVLKPGMTANMKIYLK